MPLNGPPVPHPKTVQLAAGRPKRYRRKVASTKTWAALHEEKNGCCRVCDQPGPNQLHHLVPRSQGGDDVADNLVPVCRHHHDQVEQHDPDAVRGLLAGLTDDEYAFCIEKAGESFFERRYGLVYTRTASQ